MLSHKSHSGRTKGNSSDTMLFDKVDAIVVGFERWGSHYLCANLWGWVEFRHDLERF